MTGRYSNNCIRNIYTDSIALPEFGSPYWPPLYDVPLARERGSLEGSYFPANQDPKAEIHSLIREKTSKEPDPPSQGVIATVQGVTIKSASYAGVGRNTYFWFENGWFYELDAPDVLPGGTPAVIDVITDMIELDLVPAASEPEAP